MFSFRFLSRTLFNLLIFCDVIKLRTLHRAGSRWFTKEEEEEEEEEEDALDLRMGQKLSTGMKNSSALFAKSMHLSKDHHWTLMAAITAEVFDKVYS